jgi:hypothetical protein
MKPFLLLPAFSLSLLCGVPSAYGQPPRPERPYRGLFGGGVDGVNQLLTANLSLGGGYDDNVLPDVSAGGSGNPLEQKAGALGHFSAGLNYSLSRNRVNAGASAGTSVRYYPSITSSLIHARNGTAGVSVRVLDKPTITLSQSAAYQPVSIATLFPAAIEPNVGEGAPPDLDVVLTEDHYLSYFGGLGLNQRLTRRSTFSGDYSYRIRNASRTRGQFNQQRAGTTFLHSLSRDLGLRLGYGYADTNYASGERIGYHNADVGLDFNKALAVSRRTTLSFTTGSSASTHGSRVRYRATGSARVLHEIGRTWNASLAYRRGMQFVETLEQPIFGDSATFQVGGFLNRRVQFQSSARALIGDSGFSESNSFDTYHGVASVSVGVTRHVGLTFGYSYYHYRFDPDVPLPVGVARTIDRQSVRAQVNLWAPLYQPRTRDAAR